MFGLLRFMRLFFQIRFLASIAIPLIIVAMLSSFITGQPMSANNILADGFSIVKEIIKNVDFFNTGLLKQEEEIVTEEGQVVKAVDGDTFYVRRSDGKTCKVRLIGVNSPETTGDYADKPQPYGKEASEFAKEQLLDKTVYLESDVGLEDKYGRRLYYVYLKKPKDSSEIESTMYNAILVREGLAEVMKVQPNIRYQDIFTELQKEAREGNRGLWKE